MKGLSEVKAGQGNNEEQHGDVGLASPLTFTHQNGWGSLGRVERRSRQADADEEGGKSEKELMEGGAQNLHNRSHCVTLCHAAVLELPGNGPPE